MKNILLALFCLITFGVHAQTISNAIIKKKSDPFSITGLSGPKPYKMPDGYPDYIKKLGNAFKSLNIDYEIFFTDLVKFKHQRFKNGTGLGVVIITNRKYPDCSLKYNVAQFTNKDSVTHDIFNYYSLASYAYFNNGPTARIFYMDDLVFFTDGFFRMENMDDRVKYMSLRLANDMDLYNKISKGKN